MKQAAGPLWVVDLPPQQFRQLGDVGGDAPRLVPGGYAQHTARIKIAVDPPDSLNAGGKSVEGLPPRECSGWRGAKPVAGRDSLQRRQ